jgi:hypothetical protein
MTRLTPLHGLVALFLLVEHCGSATVKKPPVSVPVCHGVTLSARYLAEIGPEKAPGFQFSLKNDTAREIRLAEPVPSSSHWYARTHGRWLWRASNGAGGSLLDATNERSPLVVYKPAAGVPEQSFTVKPHQTREWVESELENPVLAYQPGCPICSYPGEREYQVVFAYAYLSGEKQAKGVGLLACGLRSKPVPMPPKP